MKSNTPQEDLQDIIQWDIKTWSQALDFWEQNAEIPKGTNALTIGERGGGMTLWLAKKGVHVICSDYNDFPESTAILHQKHEVESLVSYKDKVDVCDLNDFPAESFDIVVFKSVIGALSEKEKQVKALAEIHRVLKNGGILLFAENLEGSTIHQWVRKKFVRWGSYWRYLNFEQDQDLFAAYSSKKFHQVGFLSGFGRSEKQRNFLASIDKGIQKITPSRWKTVLIGVLKK
ncbi:MAG: class I SAM-dependent methyltransferase [Bacteroidota bacterium]